MVATVAPAPVSLSRRDSLSVSVDRIPPVLNRRAFVGGLGWLGSELVQRLASALWERMPFAKLDLAQEYDRTELARAYSDSYQQLEQAANDVAALFLRLKEQATRVLQDSRISADVRHEWKRRHHESQEAKMRVPIVPPDSALTYRTVGEADLAERLHTALHDRVQQLATDIWEALQHLAKEQLIGRIEWANESDCRFTFQQFQLSQEFLRTISKKVAIQERVTRRQGISTREREVVQNTFSVIRHEHELINARQHELSHTVFPIPQPVDAFVKTIPDWMLPQMRVVEGTQIRERIGEVQTLSEEWCSQPKEVDRVLFHNDPALVLGPFVLMGWGQREIAAETERLSVEQIAAEQTKAEERQAENAALSRTISGAALWSSLGLLVLAYVTQSPVCWFSAWAAGAVSIIVPLLAPASNGISPGSRSARHATVLAGIQALLSGMNLLALGFLVLLVCLEGQSNAGRSTSKAP